MLRQDIDLHEDAAMKQHNRLLLSNVTEQRQLVESLKHHVMPVDEIIVLQVKYDELTGKVPFVPRFPSYPTALHSEDRVVRGYKVCMYVQTTQTSPEYQDHYGVYLQVEGDPVPCKVNFTHELVHHNGLPASAVKQTAETLFAEGEANWGIAKFIAKARLP